MKSSNFILALSFLILLSTFEVIPETESEKLTGMGPCTGPGIKRTERGSPTSHQGGDKYDWYVWCKDADRDCFDIRADTECTWWLDVHYEAIRPPEGDQWWRIYELPDSTWTAEEAQGGP
jgi:hypothetical protein